RGCRYTRALRGERPHGEHLRPRGPPASLLGPVHEQPAGPGVPAPLRGSDRDLLHQCAQCYICVGVGRLLPWPRKPLHYRVQLEKHEGARGPDRSYGVALVEQPPAVAGRVERDDPIEEAVGQ
ncbi:unnamed protein product, partial [Laminaria digitata]